MAQPTGRLIRLLLLIAACAVVASIAGQLLFPGNFRRIILGWLVLSVVVLLVPFLSWYLEPTTGPTPRKDLISIFVSIASSLILIGSLGLGWLSLDITQQQTKKALDLSTLASKSAQVEQKSRRFMDALENLDGQGPHTRLAGVYAFRRLDEEFRSEEDWKASLANADKDTLQQEEEARDAVRKDHWEIVDILTHFVQEVTPQPKDSSQLNDPVIRVEVYEIIKYLGRRKLHDVEPKGLNLINVDLRAYDFKEIRSTEKGCKDVCDGHCRPNFDRAKFEKANLSGANLECFSLRNAILNATLLQGASLRNADLTGADLDNAHLEGADLTGAIISRDNQLEFALADEKTKCPTSFIFQADTGTCVKGSPQQAAPLNQPTP